jgi:chromosome segregation ATPase
MNQAHAHGVVKVGTEVLSKLQEKEQIIFDLENEIGLQKEAYEKRINQLQENIKELKQKHSDLASDHIELQGRYKELKENVKKYYPKDYEDMFHE